MSDLTTWLVAQLDDDIATFDALDSTALNGIESTAGWSAREYIERGRAEVDAKRSVIEWCESVLSPHPEYQVVVAEGVLRRMALPYADRPGYRDEWRP